MNIFSLTSMQNQNYNQSLGYNSSAFDRSKSLRNTGVALFISGAVTTFGLGVGMFVGGANKLVKTDGYSGAGMVIGGSLFIWVGTPLTISGIICWAIGQTKMNRFSDDGLVLFKNSKCNLNMAIGGNNVGLNLNF